MKAVQIEYELIKVEFLQLNSVILLTSFFRIGRNHNNLYQYAVMMEEERQYCRAPFTGVCYLYSWLTRSEYQNINHAILFTNSKYLGSRQSQLVFGS